MHLHNVEDIKAMEGCFGFEGGNKIVNDYIEKFAELIVQECAEIAADQSAIRPEYRIRKHFGVEE